MLRTHGNRRFAEQAGFSLIELMVSVVASSIVLVAAATFLAQTGRDSAAEHVEQTTKDDLTVALQMLKTDVQHAGIGIPMQMPVQNTVDLLNNATELGWVVRYTIQDADNVGINRGAPIKSPAKMNGSDELWVGGMGMDLSPTGSKINMVIDGPSNSIVTVPRWDALYEPRWDGNANAVNLALEPTAGLDEYLSIVHPSRGWKNVGGPTKIKTVDTTKPGILEVELESALGEDPERGDIAYSVRSPGLGIAPWYLQTVHWWLDQNGTLNRRIYHRPEDAPGTFVDIPVLRNVVDFQVAYLVWACNSPAPQWIHDLVGHFDGSPYVTTPGPVGLANRFMAMRERLMSIRVSLFVRQPIERTRDIDPWFKGSSDTNYVVENHDNTNLDRSVKYLAVEQVIDPINVRLKTGTAGTTLYPRIVNSALDQKTFNGGTCDAKAGAL